MKLPRDLDATGLVKALGGIRWRIVRQTGSHVRLHQRIGTLASILSDIESLRKITREELLALLK